MKYRYDTFISYSREDAHHVKPIVLLLSLNNQRVFWDKNVNPGTLWKEEILKAIRSSKNILVMWCCHAAASKYVGQEVAYALEEKKTLAPVLLCLEPVPEPVSDYQWVDLTESVQHNCDKHKAIKSAPKEYVDFSSIWKGIIGSEPLTSESLDTYWGNKIRRPYLLQTLVAFVHLLAGYGLLSLSVVRPFSSLFAESVTILINILVGLSGLFLIMRGFWVGWNAHRRYIKLLRQGREIKILGLTILDLFDQLKRGAIYKPRRSLKDD